MLGVELRPLDNREAAAAGLPGPGGLAVIAVDPRGPASGVLEEGDILLMLDGKPVTLARFKALGRGLTRGERATLIIQRGPSASRSSCEAAPAVPRRRALWPARGRFCSGCLSFPFERGPTSRTILGTAWLPVTAAPVARDRAGAAPAPRRAVVRAPHAGGSLEPHRAGAVVHVRGFAGAPSAAPMRAALARRPYKDRERRLAGRGGGGLSADGPRRGAGLRRGRRAPRQRRELRPGDEVSVFGFLDLVPDRWGWPARPPVGTG